MNYPRDSTGQYLWNEILQRPQKRCGAQYRRPEIWNVAILSVPLIPSRSGRARMRGMRFTISVAGYTSVDSYVGTMELATISKSAGAAAV